MATTTDSLKNYVGALVALATRKGSMGNKLNKNGDTIFTTKVHSQEEAEELNDGVYNLKVRGVRVRREYTLSELTDRLRIYLGALKLRKFREKRTLEPFTGILKPVMLKPAYNTAFAKILTAIKTSAPKSSKIIGELVTETTGTDGKTNYFMTRQIFASILNVYLRTTSEQEMLTFTPYKFTGTKLTPQKATSYRAYKLQEDLLRDFANAFVIMTNANRLKLTKRNSEGKPLIHYRIKEVIHELNKKRITKKPFVAGNISQKDYAGFVSAISIKTNEDIYGSLAGSGITIHTLFRQLQTALSIETIILSLVGKQSTVKGKDSSKKIKNLRGAVTQLENLMNYLSKNPKILDGFSKVSATFTTRRGSKSMTTMDVIRTRSTRVNPVAGIYNSLNAMDSTYGTALLGVA